MYGERRTKRYIYHLVLVAITSSAAAAAAVAPVAAVAASVAAVAAAATKEEVNSPFIVSKGEGRTKKKRIPSPPASLPNGV